MRLIMWAMENKGLNIFNSSCILADTHTATDQDFIELKALSLMNTFIIGLVTEQHA